MPEEDRRHVEATLNSRPNRWKDIAAMGVTSVTYIAQEVGRLADAVEALERSSLARDRLRIALERIADPSTKTVDQVERIARGALGAMDERAR